MPRSCWILELKEGIRLEDVMLSEISNSKFSNLLKDLDTTRERNTILAATKTYKKEKLLYEGRKKGGLEFKFQCLTTIRYPVSSGIVGEEAEMLIKFPIWFRVNSPFVLTFCPRKSLAKALAVLLSCSLTDDPKSLSIFNFDLAFLRNLLQWLTSSSHRAPGALVNAVLNRVSWMGENYDVIRISKPALEVDNFFLSLLKNTKEWYSVRFLTPLIEGLKKQYRCQLYSSGKITLFSLGETSDIFNILFREFEEILAEAKLYEIVK